MCAPINVEAAPIFFSLLTLLLPADEAGSNSVRRLKKIGAASTLMGAALRKALFPTTFFAKLGFLQAFSQH